MTASPWEDDAPVNTRESSVTWRVWARTWRIDRDVAACALLTVLLLLPGLGWGIPHATSDSVVRGWDVDGVAGIGVLAELHNLTVSSKPNWYVAYPLFHYLVLAAVYAPYLAFLLLTGRLQAPSGVYPYGFADPVGSIAVLAVLGRVVSVAMACVVVCAVFVMARRMFGRGPGWIAAVLTLLGAPFLFYARTGNLDVPALCWIMLTFVAVQRAWMDGLTTRRAVACGVFAALAVATKDQAYGLLLPPLALLAWRAMRQPGADATRAWRSIAVLAASGIAAFAVAGGLILRPDPFIRHLRYITSFEGTFANVRTPNELTILRPSSLQGYALLAGDFVQGLATAIGWPALLAGVIGLALCWQREGTVRWMVAAVLGFFVLVIAPIHHMQYRYVLPASCVLAIGAAGALSVLGRRAGRPGLVMGSIVLVAGALPGAAELTYAQVVDARWAASRWMAMQLHAGDTLGYFGRPPQLPLIPAGVHVEALADTGDAAAALERIRPRWLVVAPDYFADSSRERSNFLPPALYTQLLDGSRGWRRVARFVSPSLLGRPLPYFPYVNPMVQVFERVAARPR